MEPRRNKTPAGFGPQDKQLQQGPLERVVPVA